MNIVHNKYYTWYMAIVTTAHSLGRSKKAGIYYEGHHIVPRSLGGDNKKANLVLLTPKEHLLCHMLLPRFLEGKEKGKMVWALHRLTYNGSIRTTGQYELVRKQHSENQSKPKSEATKQKMRKPKSENHRQSMRDAQKRMKDEGRVYTRSEAATAKFKKTINERYPEGIRKGAIYSEESRKKMSASHKGFKASPETRKLLSEQRSGAGNIMYGKKHSEETRQKMKDMWVIRRQKMAEAKALQNKDLG